MARRSSGEGRDNGDIGMGGVGNRTLNYWQEICAAADRSGIALSDDDWDMLVRLCGILQSHPDDLLRMLTQASDVLKPFVAAVQDFTVTMAELSVRLSAIEANQAQIAEQARELARDVAENTNTAHEDQRSATIGPMPIERYAQRIPRGAGARGSVEWTRRMGKWIAITDGSRRLVDLMAADARELWNAAPLTPERALDIIEDRYLKGEYRER